MLLDPSALLRTKFAFWFESARKIRARPHGKSASAYTESASARAEDPRRSTQLSAGVGVEQPRNSSEKVSFPCHVPYILLYLS